MTPAPYPVRLAQVAAAYLTRRTTLPTGPLRVWVEVTNVCNLRCPMCLTPKLGNEVPKGLMKLEHFEAIMRKVAPYARDVNLFLGGEPLINKQLPAMIRVAKAHGLRTRLHTNATLLTEAWAHDLIDAGLDFLSFSFDGADAETYAEFRPGSDFEATCANIQRFAAIKAERGVKHPMGVVQLIERPEWDAAKREAQREGLRRLFEGPGIDRLKFIKLHNFGGLLPGEHFTKDKDFSPCSFLWYALNVGFDGTVVPCCLDFARQYPVGNMVTDSLEEVWNGPLLVALREKMVQAKAEEVDLCRGCDVPYKPKVFGIPLRDGASLREFVASALPGRR
jgi:MoaA/NifB/PqqE/SkfB family radical SAM enzyme